MLNLLILRQRYPIVLLSLACWFAPQLSAHAQLPDLQATPPAEFSNSVATADYVLGAGDQVSISVFDYEEFAGARVVLPDGTIALPLIGSIRAAGKTVDMLAKDLTAQLQPFLVDPVVTVSLATMRPVVVNVAGEVQRPGPLQLTSLTDTRTSLDTNARISAGVTAPTLSAALIAAGGINRNADIRNVSLRRPLPGGNFDVVTINLWNAVWSDAAQQNMILRDGDSIFVPKLPVGEVLDQRLIASSSLAPATVRVRVVGEVTRPGEVAVPPNGSISSAVAIAGGPTVDAKLSEVAFIRLREDGQVEKQVIDLRNLTDNYQIQEGDVIVVGKKNTSSILDFAARLLNPLGSLLNLF